jgi:hypothetical protein
MMKKYALLFFCLFCTLSAFAYPRLWMGTYACSGANSWWGGGAYQGEVYIQPQGENFSVIWRVGFRQTQVGVGILYGDILSVAYTDCNNPLNWGVVTFRVVGDGELQGFWCTHDSYTQKPEYLVWKGY